MHSYTHNIKTFNNATRHLTRVERSLYRDLIELYYDTEQPLPAVDFDRLARRVLAVTDEEKDALRYVLSEFFTQTGDVYSHDYCDEQIEQYQTAISAKAAAGRASAAARKKKAEERKQQRSNGVEQILTGVEQPLNGCATNKKPITSNQKPGIKEKDSCSEQSLRVAADPPEFAIPLNNGSTHPVTADDLNRWAELYPAVDVRQQLRAMLGWLEGNPKKRKTKSGVVRFVTSWLDREQNRGGSRAPPAQQRVNLSGGFAAKDYSDTGNFQLGVSGDD